MPNIAEMELEVKDDVLPVPLSLEWETVPGHLPWETNVVDGFGSVVAACPRADLAEYVRTAGNHFAECRDTLVSARELLIEIINCRASLADAVAMVTELEETIAAAGGSY